MKESKHFTPETPYFVTVHSRAREVVRTYWAVKPPAFGPDADGNIHNTENRLGSHEELEPVIFRRWRSGDKGVIAFFPAIPEDTCGYKCLCFEHVGQHGAVDYALVVCQTRLAKITDPDVQALAEELAQRGYALAPCKRETRIHRETRQHEGKYLARRGHGEGEE